MKNSLHTLSLFGCLAVGITLSACVDPYAGGPSRQVTTYSTGYEVTSLPPGYRTEMIGRERYYSHNGTYYRPRSGRYVVVENPSRGEYRRDYDDRRPSQEVVIRTLPSGYRTETYNGTRYYRANDRYYQRRGDGYIIVERPRY